MNQISKGSFAQPIAPLKADITISANHHQTSFVKYLPTYFYGCPNLGARQSVRVASIESSIIVILLPKDLSPQNFSFRVQSPIKLGKEGYISTFCCL